MPDSKATFAAWAAVHHLDRRWVASLVGSWVVLALAAAITVPLKYPYEARGDVLDSGVVIGLLLPVAVLGVALDEGPSHLPRTASRSLFLPRSGLAASFLVAAAGAAATLGAVADLPVGLVAADAALFAGLTLLGTSLVGVSLGWLPAAAAAVTVSAPGVVPWGANLLYHRTVGAAFGALVLGVVALGLLAYGLCGAGAGRFPQLGVR